MNSLLNRPLHFLRLMMPGALLMFTTAASHAHPGHGAHSSGMAAGITHSLFGGAGLLAALTVGMLATLGVRFFRAGSRRS